MDRFRKVNGPIEELPSLGIYIEDVDLLTTVSRMLHDYCRFAWVVHDIHYVCPTTALYVHFDTLVPMPCPDFISQPWRKIGRRPGNIATSQTTDGGLS